MSNKFPVLGFQKYKDCPRWVKWECLLLYERRALRTHSQSFEKLATRGGLSPKEIHSMANDTYWSNATDEEAVSFVNSIAWEPDVEHL